MHSLEGQCDFYRNTVVYMKNYNDGVSRQGTSRSKNSCASFLLPASSGSYSWYNMSFMPPKGERTKLTFLNGQRGRPYPKLWETTSVYNLKLCVCMLSTSVHSNQKRTLGSMKLELRGL